MGFPGGTSDKYPSANAGDIRDTGLIRGSGCSILSYVIFSIYHSTLYCIILCWVCVYLCPQEDWKV